MPWSAAARRSPPLPQSTLPAPTRPTSSRSSWSRQKRTRRRRARQSTRIGVTDDEGQNTRKTSGLCTCIAGVQMGACCLDLQLCRRTNIDTIPLPPTSQSCVAISGCLTVQVFSNRRGAWKRDNS